MEAKVSVEEKVRSGLEGVVEVAEKLINYCQTTEELVNVCRLALTSDAQLKILLVVMGVKK
jgi:hypothetical protein